MKQVRWIAAAAAVLALGAFAPQQAEAQFKFGAQVAYADGGDIFEDAVFGLGARVGIDPPLIPFSFWAHGDYYFPDDLVDTGTNTDASQGYQTVGVDAHFTPLPFPMVTPYLTVGGLIRRFTADGTIGGIAVDESNTEGGFVLGAGVDIGVLVSGTLQARYEIFGDDAGGNQFVLRAGVTF